MKLPPCPLVLIFLLLPLLSHGEVAGYRLPTEFYTADKEWIEMDDACVAGAFEVRLGSIRIDGDFSDWGDFESSVCGYGFPNLSWTPGPLAWGEKPSGVLPEPENSSGRWMAAWDSQFLYIAVEATDDTMTEGDRIDLFIDGDFSHQPGFAYNQSGYDGVNDWHKIIHADGSVEMGMHDASATQESDLGMEVATALTDEGFRMELRIRIQSINADRLVAEYERYLGFDIKLTDSDEPGVYYGRDSVIAWCSEYNDTYASPELFGVLVLAEREFCPDLPPIQRYCTYDCPREFWCPCEENQQGALYTSTNFGFLDFSVYQEDFWVVYAYGLEAWLWMGPVEKFYPNSFWCYDLSNGRWLWGNESWGYFYDLSAQEWIDADPRFPLPF